jgi:hypothetical protein
MASDFKLQMSSWASTLKMFEVDRASSLRRAEQTTAVDDELPTSLPLVRSGPSYLDKAMALSSAEPVSGEKCYFNAAVREMEGRGKDSVSVPQVNKSITSRTERAGASSDPSGVEFSRSTVAETGRPEVTRVLLSMIGEDYLSRVADPVRDLEKREHLTGGVRARGGVLIDSSSLLLSEKEDFTTRKPGSKVQLIHVPESVPRAEQKTRGSPGRGSRQQFTEAQAVEYEKRIRTWATYGDDHRH